MLEKPNFQNGAKSTRVWCDGCYDLVHFGHANSLRQAKALGDHLVVGIHTDEEVTKHKGPPVFTFEERCKMISAIKWVDEVVEGSPYVTDLEILNEHACDFCCHGDDITLTDAGEDTYHKIKEAGRYREVQRTPGISTTGLVDRILAVAEKTNRKELAKSPWTGSSKFLLTAGKIVQFSQGRPPKEGDVVVYVVGAFDLFHVGHLYFLEKARELGNYLIVGLYSDQVINRYKGDNHPIMTLHERLLSLLACKYVSEVVIDAPMAVTKDLMEWFKIDVVAGGRFGVEDGADSDDPYKYPKEVRKFVEINSGSDVTTEKIIERIVKNKLEYMERNEKKEKKELDLINEMEKKQEWKQTS
ncbi:hypothetical protein Zmor_005616 [Zophobas morio]|uniref:ethanolamine-phosphate cytidylyltransferase n=1 Tax=Zophobas morio TaxID=2755281 RepID=A0AA38MMF1_9CUCU|nr:hypothetical protein Zmor_005616 [Zophobas morio]